MSDHLDRDADDAQARAAAMIGQFTPTDVPGYRMRYAVNAASALAAAGLLASPERDAELERLRGERHNLTAEVVRLQTALTDIVDDWEAVGRSGLHPLIRGAALSAAGRVRDVLWPEEADDE